MNTYYNQRYTRKEIDAILEKSVKQKGFYLKLKLKIFAIPSKVQKPDMSTRFCMFCSTNPIT